jgi:hypothetical protein
VAAVFRVLLDCVCEREIANKSEDDLKSFQSVGQIVGDVLRPLDHQRSKL